MNQIVTIPKSIVRKGELVVIPRKEYEGLLRLAGQKVATIKKMDPELEKALEEARRGKTIGPFNNARDLIKSLRSHNLHK